MAGHTPLFAISPSRARSHVWLAQTTTLQWLLWPAEYKGIVWPDCSLWAAQACPHHILGEASRTSHNYQLFPERPYL